LALKTAGNVCGRMYRPEQPAPDVEQILSYLACRSLSLRNETCRIPVIPGWTLTRMTWTRRRTSSYGKMEKAADLSGEPSLSFLTS
jgi:hypothetical protein